MEFEGFPKIARLSRECIVTEKIDGTNGQILWTDDMQSMLVGSRTRWTTTANDNHGFAQWASDHIESLRLLGPGRHFGEWWGQGIQRGYGLKERRFSLFNALRWIRQEEDRQDEKQKVMPECCYVVPILYQGQFDECRFQAYLNELTIFGSHAAPGFMHPEGIVVYHMSGNVAFKKTIDGDDTGKGRMT